MFSQNNREWLNIVAGSLRKEITESATDQKETHHICTDSDPYPVPTVYPVAWGIESVCVTEALASLCSLSVIKVHLRLIPGDHELVKHMTFQLTVMRTEIPRGLGLGEHRPLAHRCSPQRDGPSKRDRSTQGPSTESNRQRNQIPQEKLCTVDGCRSPLTWAHAMDCHIPGIFNETQPLTTEVTNSRKAARHLMTMILTGRGGFDYTGSFKIDTNIIRLTMRTSLITTIIVLIQIADYPEKKSPYPRWLWQNV